MTKTDKDMTHSERLRAYKLAGQASNKLDKAAQELGFEDVHDLASEVREMDVNRQTDDGIKAITNAHSYLNNGQLECLVKGSEEK